MFIPLRVHSVFSKGHGGLTLGEAAAWAAREKLPAAALTDIGNIHGWAKWKRAAEARWMIDSLVVSSKRTRTSTGSGA